MEIYIIRHGQSVNNSTEHLAQRVCDPPLTAVGRQQAQCLARRLENLDWARLSPNDCEQGLHLTRLYTSPMLRAIQTAEAIRQTTGLLPHVRDDIHEHGGIWLDHDDGRGPIGLPGLGRSQIQQQFPHAVVPESIRDDGWWNRPFEPDQSAYARAQRVGKELKALADMPERIGFVSHGGYADNLISTLLDMPFVGYVRFGHNNTAVTRLDLGSERVALQFLNRVDHLPQELVT